MWVYGDRVREAEPAAEIAALRQRLAVRGAPASPVERHDRLRALFIAASELAQGLADVELEARGREARTATGEAATALLMILAKALLASWSALPHEPEGATHAVDEAAAALDALDALPLPQRVRLKTGEGYAYYALYPEAHAAAALQLAVARAGRGAGVTVIGVRSIGLGLATAAAAALRAEPPLSVRPIGPPFRRELRLGEALEAELAGRVGRPFVVVDEGPGLSGSSLGAVADALERLGAPRASIAFLPSHAGDLGREASEPHSQRWASAERPVVQADALLGDGAALVQAFADLAGPDARLTDISGGGWREASGLAEADWPAVDARQERRKWRLEGRAGAWMLKFQGLGDHGMRAFEAARRLGEAGWSPPAEALRHGVSATRWIAPARAPDVDDAFLDRLGDYLGWRARALEPPPTGGASLEDLREMLRANAAEAFGEAAVAGARVLDPGLWRDAPPIRRIWTDNRLHAHEWLGLADGGWLKTDAVDHAVGHDMVGAQDLAWDLAGARAEFALSDIRAERLLRRVREHAPVEPALVSLMEPAYLAFQLGLWTLAAAAQAGWPQEAGRLEACAGRYSRALRVHFAPS